MELPNSSPEHINNLEEDMVNCDIECKDVDDVMTLHADNVNSVTEDGLATLQPVPNTSILKFSICNILRLPDKERPADTAATSGM